jgi:hypothetical protein
MSKYNFECQSSAHIGMRRIVTKKERDLSRVVSGQRYCNACSIRRRRLESKEASNSNCDGGSASSVSSGSGSESMPGAIDEAVYAASRRARSLASVPDEKLNCNATDTAVSALLSLKPAVIKRTTMRFGSIAAGAGAALFPFVPIIRHAAAVTENIVILFVVFSFSASIVFFFVGIGIVLSCGIAWSSY